MSGGGQNTTVQKNDPWPEAQPYLKDIMGQAQTLQQQGVGSQTWSGPTIAAQSPWSTYSKAYLGNLSQNGAASGADAAQGALSQGGVSSAMQPAISTLNNISQSTTPTASASYLTGMASSDGSTNPWLKQMLDANAERIGNQVASQMSGMGRYGSAGHEQALAKTINETNLPILSQAYDSDMARKLQAAGQIDSANQAQTAQQMGAANSSAGILGAGLDRIGALQGAATMPAQLAGSVGASDEARAQAELDAQRSLWEQAQQMPWTQLGKYENAVQGLGGVMGNGTTTTTQSSSSSPLSFLGPMMSLFSILSDARTKKNVEYDGTVDRRTGAPNAKWHYKWQDDLEPRYSGPIAQDVAVTRPDLIRNVGGLLAIAG
jgi:hypothetical protein